MNHSLSGMSAVQCVFIAIETMHSYLHNDIDVYMCTIDASKAFDRVNLFVLFSNFGDVTFVNYT